MHHVGLSGESVTATPHYDKVASLNWRGDIQALRGLAVTLVVLQHAGLSLLPGGYLGVDVFFVISGFLMGRILINDIDGKTFTFASFYARRARRLLPAAYATIVATALAAPFLLDPYELRDLVDQIIGAFTFSINVVLWRQVDYFGSGAELKPLLHMWSLAIEEQFYLVLPLLLLIIPRTWRMVAIAACAVGSAALCFYAVRLSPSAAFYLLPTRAWELGIGVLVALIAGNGQALRSIPILRLGLLAVLLVLPVLVDNRGHPGWAALLICLATAGVVLTRPAHAEQRWLGPAVWLGDRSYSLYLAHWPLFAFANNVFLDHPSWEVRAGLLAATLVAAEALYRFVETPFRRLTISGRVVGALVCLPIAVIGLMFATVTLRQQDLSDRAGNTGLASTCVSEGTFVPKPECASSAEPQTLLWGDSFAMHLAVGLAKTSPEGVLQATQPVCGPFLSIAPTDGGLHSVEWAEQCIGFNRSVLDYLAQEGSPRTVALSSSLLQYLPGAEDKPWSLLTESGEIIPLSTERLIAGLRETVAAVTSLGKRAVLVAPPPGGDYDIARCFRREQAGIVIVSDRTNCALTTAEFHEARSEVRGFLDQVRALDILPVISFEEALCDDQFCRIEIDGAPVYRDAGWHFSRRGIEAVAAEMNLGGLVAAQ